MSCHVMSCRHYCIEFLKKSFSKTFLFFKIIYKYFAGFLACINKLFKSLRAVRRSNPLYLDCHASCQRHAYGVEARNDMESKIRNDRIFCNEIQFDKFQRFLSVIYKKFITKGDLNYVKSQNNF